MKGILQTSAQRLITRQCIVEMKGGTQTILASIVYRIKDCHPYQINALSEIVCMETPQIKREGGWVNEKC